MKVFDNNIPNRKYTQAEMIIDRRSFTQAQQPRNILQSNLEPDNT